MKVYVAIPLLREFENIKTLLDYIFKQDFKDFQVVFCVNNPAEWYELSRSSSGILSHSKDEIPSAESEGIQSDSSSRILSHPKNEIPSAKSEVIQSDCSSGILSHPKNEIPSAKSEVIQSDSSSGILSHSKNEIPSAKSEGIQSDSSSGILSHSKDEIPSNKSEVIQSDCSSGILSHSKDEIPSAESDEFHSHQKDIEDNLKTLDYLQNLNNPQVTVIDKATKGNAFPLKKSGVGYARKVIMDKIASVADDNDIIICLDGDTIFSPQYFSSVVYQFENNKDAHAIAVPYYHRLEGSKEQQAAALRYEIYMRHYLIEMLKINNPYSFTALGAAIAVKVGSYKKVGGITPYPSGEDFYLLQKIRKMGRILLWCDEHVYPKGRLSDRVGFGTGPAIEKGMDGNWNSYPIYKTEYFENIKKTFDLFPTLFEEDVDTPLTPFLQKQFNTDDIWSPLRNNYKDVKQFVRACETKVDGLRILQYLKSTCEDFSYFPYDDKKLYEVRDRLYQKENNLRIKFDVNYHTNFSW